MNDAQIVDLHDVEAYLKSRKLVDDRHLPYYIRWVQRFLTGPGGDSRLSAEDAHRAFLERLNQSGAVPEWQIRQASRAVELFYLPDTVRSFLAELALKRGVAASTQNQAFCALLFLMREVLGRDTACLNSLRAKSGPHLPVVFSEKEAAHPLPHRRQSVGCAGAGRVRGPQTLTRPLLCWRDWHRNSGVR